MANLNMNKRIILRQPFLHRVYGGVKDTLRQRGESGRAKTQMVT